MWQLGGGRSVCHWLPQCSVWDHIIQQSQLGSMLDEGEDYFSEKRYGEVAALILSLYSLNYPILSIGIYFCKVHVPIYQPQSLHTLSSLPCIAHGGLCSGCYIGPHGVLQGCPPPLMQHVLGCILIVHLQAAAVQHFRSLFMQVDNQAYTVSRMCVHRLDGQSIQLLRTIATLQLRMYVYACMTHSQVYTTYCNYTGPYCKISSCNDHKCILIVQHVHWHTIMRKKNWKE